MAIVILFKWSENNDSNYLIISAIFGFVAISQYSMHFKTFIELTSDTLKIKRKGLLGLINDEYKIELNSIQSTYYEKKTFDNWELYQRLLWELLFPSGQSFLIINLSRGKQEKIPFNGNEDQLKKLIEKLPERIPN